MAITSKGRRALGLLVMLGVAGAGIFAVKQFAPPGAIVSSVPTAEGGLAAFKEGEVASTSPSEFAPPTDEPAVLDTVQIRHEQLAWNAQSGENLANGGVDTTKGSIYERLRVNLHLQRETKDDYMQMQALLVACANQLSQGQDDCTQGVHFVTIMGDGGPAFFAGLNETLAKLGPEYVAETIGGTGRSYGEDAFMGPPACVKDPKVCQGLLVAGVPRDGDWNIALSWAHDNAVCNNPDKSTYDPDCLNWVETASFVEADEKFVQRACEERPVVHNGRKTGEDQKVCVDGVVTWTPGDVDVTEQRGGVDKIRSTRENDSQMPVAIIGIKKWNAAHKEAVVNLLVGALEGGDIIKAQPGTLMLAGKVNAAVYGEHDAAWWARYYRGAEQMDMTGRVSVKLGGSRVFNAADAARFWGLEAGYANAFAASYTFFGDIAKQQYPKLMPDYPAAGEVFNATYLREAVKRIAARGAEQAKADAPDFTATVAEKKLGDRNVTIEFDTGKDTIRAASAAVLDDVLKSLTTVGNSRVELHGYTDDVGDDAMNQELSGRRAASVKGWLQEKAAGNFPDARFAVVAGHGESDPVAPNTSAKNRAANRRVRVVILANE